jgi:glutamine synthetase
MRYALGEEAFSAFLKEKRKEWDLYRTQVTSWEFERYVRKL